MVAQWLERRKAGTADPGSRELRAVVRAWLRLIRRPVAAIEPAVAGGSVAPTTERRPRLIAAPPAFDRAPDGRLVSLEQISAASNNVGVAAGPYYLFLYLSSPVSGVGAARPAGVCEVELFKANGSGHPRGPRCVHYSFPLPPAPGDGRYHAFRVVVPKVAGAAIVRFVPDGRAASRVLVSSSVFLVAATNLTYAASDPDSNRTFCPVPVGRLHCYFPTAPNCRYRLVPEIAAPRTGRAGEDSPGTATYQPMWGIAAAARAKAEGKMAAPVTLPLTPGDRPFQFRSNAQRVLIDVEFTELPEGAQLQGPLEPELAAADLRSEYLMLSDALLDHRRGEAIPAGKLLNILDRLLKTWKTPFSRLGFPEAVATSAERILSPPIIAVAGESLATHLAALSGFVAATETNALDLLDAEASTQPGIVLVELLFHRAGASWTEEGTTPITEDPGLLHLLRAAGERGWTRVFWFSEDRVHLGDFSPRFALFDRVISEIDAVDEVEVGPNRAIARLPFVDLRLANPIIAVPFGKTFNRHIEEARRPFERKTLVVGWADILEGGGVEEVLDNSVLRHVHICEDQWKFRANKVADFPRLLPNIIGYLAQRQLISAFKRYGAALFFYPTLRSDAQMLRSVMLAASCNCLPVIYCSGDRPRANPLIDEIAIVVEDRKYLHHLISRIAEDDLELARRRHMIWRTAALYNASGYSLVSALGVEPEKLPPRIEEVLVSIVTPTKRPELLARAYRQICDQLHPSWEWIVVLNRPDIEPSELPEEIVADDRVRVLAAAPSKNIGFCLELGIANANGALWVKWDDDDFYGPGYLCDTLLLSQMTDAALIGRPPTYVYLERTQKLYYRPDAAAGFVLSPKEFRQTGLVSGASLAGRLDGTRPVTFSFDWRGSVDTDYMAAVAAAGGTLCSGPHLGMVAFRAADPEFHTWRIPESALLVNADQIGGERELPRVLV